MRAPGRSVLSPLSLSSPSPPGVSGGRGASDRGSRRQCAARRYRARVQVLVRPPARVHHRRAVARAVQRGDAPVLDPQRHLLSVVPNTKKYFPPDAYWDTALLTAELIFIVLIFICLLAELRWLTKHGPVRWLESVWHPADLMNCIVLSTVYFLRLALLNIADEHEFAPKPFEYSDFFEMAYYVHLIQNTLGKIYTIIRIL